MRRYIIILTLILNLLVISNYSNGQRYERKGDKAFEREQFMTAIKHYQKQFERSDKSRKTRASVSYKTAISYMRISEPEKAIEHFKEAENYNYHDNNMYFKLAEAYLEYEEFDKALSAIEKYKEKHPDDPRIDEEISRIHKTLEMLEKPTNFEVKIAAILNSGELDFCPFFGDDDYDEIFFTSSRSLIDNPEINEESGELFTDIYETEKDRDGRWQIPIKSTGNINTSFDEGAASLNDRYNVMYFSRCNYEYEDNNRPCRIYKARKRSHHWWEDKEVIIPGIPEDISIGHPAITDEECTMYFVADSMLGGYGGKDIYKITRERKSRAWSEPQNLGPDINTSANECFPYLRDNGLLYFSRDGKSSMGGLDIFVAEKKSPAKYDVENMKSPINSPADDFGIIFKKDKEEGYFTSRRRGGLGKSDIYRFENPGITIKSKGVVWDKMTNKKIESVTIELCNKKGDVIKKGKTTEEGEFDFELEKDKIYSIYFRKEPYLPKSIRVSTKDLKKSKTFNHNIFLEIR